MKLLIAPLTEEAGVSLCQEAAPRWASSLEDAPDGFCLRPGPSPGRVSGVNRPTFHPASSSPPLPELGLVQLCLGDIGFHSLMLVLKVGVGIALRIAHTGGNNPLVTGQEQNARRQEACNCRANMPCSPPGDSPFKKLLRFSQFCPSRGAMEAEISLSWLFPIPAAKASLPGLHFKALLAALCRIGLRT